MVFHALFTVLQVAALQLACVAFVLFDAANVPVRLADLHARQRANWHITDEQLKLPLGFAVDLTSHDIHLNQLGLLSAKRDHWG